MNSSPNTTSTRPKRSLAVPVTIVLVLAAIAAAWAFHFSQPHTQTPAGTNSGRWHAYQSEHDRQISMAQQQFAQHKARLAAKKRDEPPAAKTPPDTKGTH